MVQMDDMSKNNAALVYCRVSSGLLAEGTSLESQRDACVEYAIKLGYMVSSVYEEVFSGAELFARPKLSLARADIRAGKVRAVIAYSIDRLTRSEAHLAILIDECSRAGCRLIFVTGDSSAAEAYAADLERQNIRERTSRGRRAKLLRGSVVFPGSNLYGYRPDHAAGVYRVEESEAHIVRRIFAMCSQGRGMHSIASTFNREGIPSPKSDKWVGARWSSGTVSMILNSRSYMGEEVCWKTKRGEGQRDFVRPESEWVRLPDGVRPAIISEELWEACQQNIHARAARMRNNRYYPTLLRGHIFCAECGATMIRSYFKRGKYEYLKYRCGSRWRPFDTGCRGEAVSLDAVTQWAWEKVKETLLDCGGEWSLDEVAEIEFHPLAADLQAAQRAFEKNDHGLTALVSYLRNSANDPTIRPYIEREIAQATREKQQLEKTLKELEAQTGEARRCAIDLRRLSECGAFARENLENLSFDDQVLAVRGLGVKVYANGEDPSGWRYVVSMPIEPMR
jgi:DNA invertase Pin-like site-specific DNA recombinase